jgi:hypothetical protein
MPVQPRTAGTGGASLLIGPVAFVLGMAAALLLVRWIGSLVSLAVLGIGAYVLLIVALTLGGAGAYAVATIGWRWLAGRTDPGV